MVRPKEGYPETCRGPRWSGVRALRLEYLSRIFLWSVTLLETVLRFNTGENLSGVKNSSFYE